MDILAEVLWNEIPLHRPSVSLGPYVIMPNHIHGMLILAVGTGHLGTGRALSLQHKNTIESGDSPGRDRFQNIGSNTLSSIIGGYKSAVTKHANRLGLEHGWQTKFHDRIIRSDQEYQRIATYIKMNPAHWSEDEFFREESR